MPFEEVISVEKKSFLPEVSLEEETLRATLTESTILPTILTILPRRYPRLPPPPPKTTTPAAATADKFGENGSNQDMSKSSRDY